MKPEAQNQAIAEACGWTYKKPDSIGLVWVIPPKGTPPKKPIPSAPFAPCDVPNYQGSLDSMHEAEETLDDLTPYWSNLVEVVVGIPYSTVDLEDVLSAILHATAAQRAEAFLRTLNLWEE